jgi:hypothetical protein
MRSFSPKGLVIDFSDLNYVWGDDIELYPWQLKRLDRPFQFVFKPEQIEHFEFKIKKYETRISFNQTNSIRNLEEMI